MANGLTLGPLDPDNAGDLVGKLGTHNKAKALIERHARNWPRQLTLALSRPKDRLRSASLDQREVEDAVRALTGRRAFVKDDDSFVEAAVRGERESERVVSILFRKKSGRLAQGVIPYEGLTRSHAAHARLLDRSRQLPLGVEPTPELLERVADDRAVGAGDADERVAQAEEAAREAESERRAQEEQLQSLAARLESLENPEPWPGYAELEAKEKLSRIEDGGLVEFGTRGLQAIVDFEEKRDNPHRSVVKAAQALLEEAPPPDA